MRAAARAALALLALALPVLMAGGRVACAAESGIPARPLMAYHESWYERPATSGGATTLAALPGYINLVALAFARPDLDYGGNLNLAGTGLQYPFTGRVLRDAVALLKHRHPGTRVLLAVGGANYPNWDRLDGDAVARLVRDLGLDGVDVDLETAPPQCAAGHGGRVRCLSDQRWRDSVRRLRAALPRPLLLTVPGWSVGAYGEGEWSAAPPRSPYTGVLLALLRSPEAAAIDLVSIMAYEAGPAFDPWQAFLAYRHVWPGPLLLGVEAGPSEVPGPRLTASAAESLARRVAARPPAGMMLYPLLARPPGTVGPDTPDGRLLAQALCRGMGKTGCEASLP